MNDTVYVDCFTFVVQIWWLEYKYINYSYAMPSLKSKAYTLELLNICIHRELPWKLRIKMALKVCHRLNRSLNIHVWNNKAPLFDKIYSDLPFSIDNIKIKLHNVKIATSLLQNSKSVWTTTQVLRTYQPTGYLPTKMLKMVSMTKTPIVEWISSHLWQNISDLATTAPFWTLMVHG